MNNNQIEIEPFDYAINAIHNFDYDKCGDWQHRKNEMIARITMAKHINEYNLMEARNNGALNATLLMIAIYMSIMIIHFIIR